MNNIVRLKEYRYINNLLGWFVFTISLVVYLMTIEPTASFWDCSEYIASAYKLELGHPPGSPIFMLFANLVSHFVPNPSQVAMAINSFSAILSSFTILFLFWTITHFSSKLILKNETKKCHLFQLISIMGTGLIGALTYTFSDTFWFSAVEGEVYAFSSFMTSLVFWLILKWENIADEPYSDRWLILIAYMFGISIGIHLLNLLCIPAITLVYFFRKNPNPTFKKTCLVIFGSIIILAFILFGLIQGLVKIGGLFELFFINVLKFPYNSGVIFYMMLIISIFYWAIWETMNNFKNFKRAKLSFILSVGFSGIPFIGNGFGLGIFIIIILSFYLFLSKNINPISLNTILIGLLVMILGFSSYALVIIRSISNTPMDENSPENIFNLKSYLTREQYGETPLLYGQTFVSEPKYENKNGLLEAVTKDEGAIWSPIVKKNSCEKDHYYESARKKKYVYVDELNTFFPRMYSQSPYHVYGYKQWANFKGRQIEINSANGRSKCVLKPTFSENLRYFFRYQVNYMYWRYFLWNFSGKQNDIQGYGGILNGNWITGIKWIDQFRLGSQDNMPDSIIKNKGHNKFYMLPLLLGIVGILSQISFEEKGIEQFFVIFLLFFMTGLAIVLYLNQPPFQPRERDYAYVGSFYAFCIWIGIGVLTVIKKIRSYFKGLSRNVSAIVGVILGLFIPIQMVSQTWNDHDRSGRFIVRDFAKNYLSTCEKNAIIFTNGDNETFPLWYVQEVEGFRTDVRVCNLSYLQTDWYIDQMKRQAYTSNPLPIDWTRQEYIQYKHDVAYIFNESKEPIPIEIALNKIKSENSIDKRLFGYNNLEIDHISSNKILIPIDSAAVIASGLVKISNASWIPHYLLIDLSNQPNEKGEATIQEKGMLSKDEIMILDILKNNSDWKRPIYYSATTSSDKYLRLIPYFRCDGIAYRIMPFEASKYQPIDVNVMYNNVMNKYRWGNLEKPGLYLDENALRMILTFRIIFGQLASQLIIEKDYERAKKVLDKCLKVIPCYNVPYDYYSTIPLANAYFKIGCKYEAEQLYTKLAEKYLKNLKWYNRLKNNQYISILENIQKEIYYFRNILYFLENTNSKVVKKYEIDFSLIMCRFQKMKGIVFL